MMAATRLMIGRSPSPVALDLVETVREALSAFDGLPARDAEAVVSR